MNQISKVSYAGISRTEYETSGRVKLERGDGILIVSDDTAETLLIVGDFRFELLGGWNSINIFVRCGEDSCNIKCSEGVDVK